MVNVLPRLIVHGGAGNWVNFDEEAVLDGLRDAAEVGWRILRGGGMALEAVEAAARVLEDDPLFDAGYGSFLNEHGEVEMDALIADGSSIRFGAVAGVRRVRHAITLARLVMERTENCFFVGEGADQLAAQLGMPLIPNVELITEKELKTFRSHSGAHTPRAGLGTGTIGAVAQDAAGNLASATSTGGTPDKKKGRVGDSPIFGAGGYAHNGLGAASATGRGENIMRFFLCKIAVDNMNGVPAQEAVRRAVEYLVQYIPDPEAGIIALGADGSLATLHTTPAMPIAWIDEQGRAQAAMRYGGWFG
jgi:beta-aspartyl-peptidase (threonine type)